MEIIKKFPASGQKEVFLIKSSDSSLYILKKCKIDYDSELLRISREIRVITNFKSKYLPRILSYRIDLQKGIEIEEEYIEGSEYSYDIDNKMAFNIFSQVVEGMIPLWKSDIVHRDLKPNNLLVNNDKNVKIIDFGIARVLGEDSITNSLNDIGPCTITYASPEQLLNLKNNIDYRTDFYSIGVMIFIQLYKKHPFGNNPRDIYNNTINMKISVEEYNKLNLDLYRNKVLSKLLCKEVYNRYRDWSKLFIDFKKLEGEI
jgi:serine/threonine-protein kinase